MLSVPHPGRSIWMRRAIIAVAARNTFLTHQFSFEDAAENTKKIVTPQQHHVTHQQLLRSEDQSVLTPQQQVMSEEQRVLTPQQLLRSDAMLLRSDDVVAK